MWLFVAPNDDRQQAIEDARATVAFYAGAEQYEPYFAAHGFGKEAKMLQEGVKRGDYLSVKHLVTDEMAQTFVVCGTPDEVRKRVSLIWESADSACLNPPSYGLDPGAMLRYGGRSELFRSSQFTVVSSQFKPRPTPGGPLPHSPLRRRIRCTRHVRRAVTPSDWRSTAPSSTLAIAGSPATGRTNP
jgi:hypothetical protein